MQKRLEELAADGVAHVVVDAVADDDLKSIADACLDMSLVTGGSALARAMPAIWLQRGLLSERDARSQPRSVPGQSIVLSGSCSAMTNRQVSDYLAKGHHAYKLDPMVLAEQGPDAVLGWLTEQSFDTAPIVYATAEPGAVRAAQEKLGVARAGEIVEQTLSLCARAALGKGVRRFVVAGGETSGAVAKVLEIRRVDVGREIAPGVPWCFATISGDEVAVALKSGNFGAETFFSDALGAIAP